MADVLSTDPWEGVLGVAEQQTGLQPGLLSAIASQENVNPQRNNPLGLSTDQGVLHFSPDQGVSRILHQAQLITDPNGPYKDFVRTGNIDDLAKVYSPRGARNDIYGTNSTEASGIRSALNSRVLSTDPTAGLSSILSTDPQAGLTDAVPSPSLAQEVGSSPDFIAQQKPEGTVFTDPRARADLVKNVSQGLRDFVPTLKHDVATSIPRSREELVSSLQDITRQAAAPYEESIFKTVGPEKFDQPAIDLSSPYALLPGLPPGLVPALANIKGPIGDYVRSQLQPDPNSTHQPNGYERFAQSVLSQASQLTTPHSAADIYSFKVPGAQQAFAAERALSVPEQAQRVKQAYDEQGVPEAAATGVNEAVMDILPALHDAARLRDAAQYSDLLPTPQPKPSIEQKPGQVYFQPGDAEAVARRTQAFGQQISPEMLQAITQSLQRQDTGLPSMEGEAGSPNRILESAIEKSLRRTTLTPLRSATEIALNQTRKPVAQLDEMSNDTSLSNVQGLADLPLKPEKEPLQGAETDLAPTGVENQGTVERPQSAAIRESPGVERPGELPGSVETGQAAGSENLRGQINTDTGRQDRSLDPREEVLRREFGKSVEIAQKKEANNPGAGRRLADRLEKSPKAVNDPDHVLLAQQVIQAQNEYDKAARQVAANPDDKEAQHAADIADERIQQAYQAYDNAGTGTARGLAIRNVLKAHDYTLPAMEARFRTKLGRDLSPRESAEIKGIHERISAADNVLGPEAKMYAGLDPEDVKKLIKDPIVGSAVRFEDNGSVRTGSLFHSALYEGKRPVTDGFVTKSGKFLDREQAFKVAQDHRQMIEESRKEEASRAKDEGRKPELLSEDLDTTKLYAGLDPEDIAKRLGRDVKRISKDTADYQARTAAKDISPRKPRGEPLMSADKQKALYEREKAKADYHSMIERVKYEQKSPLYRGVAQTLSFPRRVAVAGHGIVFPVTHAGDLILRPASWGIFGKGFLRTYAATFNPEFHKASMGRMMDSKFKNGENAFHLATASKVDVGMGGLGAAGLVRSEGMAARAWDALKVMRFDLWKNQMEKVMRKNPSLTYGEKLEVGKELASWANHATGSGKGLLADSKVGQSLLFGPKLTQSKLNKVSIDPAKTLATFYKLATGGETSLGERVVARIRLSGAVQYATTLAGFLVANGAILQALGSKQKINFTNPNKSDFWSFKIAGTDISIPGLHSEMRYLGQILATTVASRKELRGESRQGAIFDKTSQYLRSKLSPTAQLIAEGATGQDYRGRPLPFSSEKASKFLPKYTTAEYAASKAPIPLTGPGKYVFDQMRDKGMTPVEAAETTQALTIFGLGLTGFHVHEDYPEKPKKK